MELLEGGFLATCKFVLKQIDFHKVLPFKWDYKRECLKSKDTTKRAIQKCILYYTYFWLVVSNIQVLYKWKEMENFTKSFGFSFIGVLVSIFGVTFVCIHCKQEVATHFNQMILFERRHKTRKYHFKIFIKIPSTFLKFKFLNYFSS